MYLLFISCLLPLLSASVVRALGMLRRERVCARPFISASSSPPWLQLLEQEKRKQGIQEDDELNGDSDAVRAKHSQCAWHFTTFSTSAHAHPRPQPVRVCACMLDGVHGVHTQFVRLPCVCTRALLCAALTRKAQTAEHSLPCASQLAPA